MQDLPSTGDIISAVTFMQWALGVATASIITIVAYFSRKVDKKDDMIASLNEKRTDDAKSYREGSQEGLHIIKGMAEMLAASTTAHTAAQDANQAAMHNMLIILEKHITKVDTLIVHFDRIAQGGGGER